MTPIALFTYARPAHTRRTVEALLRNAGVHEHDLIVYSDAPRTPDKAQAVVAVRTYLKTISGFRSVTIRHRPNNFGLAKSIIEGVTEVLQHSERIIVLEDDMVTSPHFLGYMNEALDRYADDERVVSVHGYVYPTGGALPETFFLRGADCWGWGTWRHGWGHFNSDGQFLLDELKRQNLLRAFDFNGAYGYSRMLRDQINGSNDSWAVRWHASAFLANKLTLYPGRSLVHNIGNDSSGTHCGSNAAFDAEITGTPICLDYVVVEQSAVAKKEFERFFRAQRRPSRRLLTRFASDKKIRGLRILARDLLPPLFARKLRRLLGAGTISFKGPFASWEEARRLSSGYDDERILDKVVGAALKVKHGEAVFERDSVLFDEIQYVWPVTAGLMWAAARNSGRLRVMDFGGSLGSTYFQNQKLIEGLSSVRWSVVEQGHFVKAGREKIQDERLVFYPTIAECVAQEQPNVALLSSVLQYLANPYALLDELTGSGVEILLVDRTPFWEGDEDLIGIQKVSKAIYPVSYPLWIFSNKKFTEYLSGEFELIAETESPEGVFPFANKSFSFNGFVMKRRKNE